MAGKYIKRCPICGGAVKRSKSACVVSCVVVEPKIKADACTECGEEFYTAEQVARAHEKAAKLGIWEPLLEEERELKQIGGSLVVLIPKTMVRALELAPGEKVRIGLEARGISVTKAAK